MDFHNPLALLDLFVGVEQAAEGEQGSCDQDLAANDLYFDRGILSCWVLFELILIAADLPHREIINFKQAQV